jgi:hypothetical protein
MDALDELEQFSDDPIRVMRIVGELRFHVARWAAESAAFAREVEQKAETIREMTQEIRGGMRVG